jgi:hypothetical protein
MAPQLRFAGTEPHEIDRFFFGALPNGAGLEPRSISPSISLTRTRGSGRRSRRMHIGAFQGDQARLVERMQPRTSIWQSRHARYAEPFQARSPPLVGDPTAFAKVPSGDLRTAHRILCDYLTTLELLREIRQHVSGCRQPPRRS